MHIFFAGIGGTAIGPLALIAKQAGFSVSGSDKQASPYIDYLKKHGITDIYIGQSREGIAALHERSPIDWMVYTSALPLENPNAPELVYCREQGIKTSKRDELLNLIIREKNLKLLAVAGTQGKTTTTAMVIWLFKQLGLPVSYSVGAKLSYGDMGEFDPKSEYFVYEADEFDRNFLAFEPYLSIITGVSWDHHEIFPTREDYQAAFREFISQSGSTVLWEEDAEYLDLAEGQSLIVQNSGESRIHELKLFGQYNRLDGWLAIQAVHRICDEPIKKLMQIMNVFPGSQRRMEKIAPGLYSDYAHTPEKIRGALSVAQEMTARTNQPIIVLYEGITNRRQHYFLDEYKDCFTGTTKLYWLPSYLAREDPNQRLLTPSEMISHLSDPSIGEAAEMGADLKHVIQKHLKDGAMVIGMSGGGPLDSWLRKEFSLAA